MTTKSRLDLVIGLIQGEQTTKGKDDDSDNETRQVPRRLIAEGWSSSASLWDSLPPTMRTTWLAVSATEWIASASIDEAPVSAHAMAFVTAIARLAEAAAMIALRPPCVGLAGSLAPFGH